MNTAGLLRDALSRLAERYDSYSVLPRGDFAELAARDQQWAREQLAALDVLPAEPEPRPFAEQMGEVFDLWLEAIRRCETDEQRASAHLRFAAAVNALCELAAHPFEIPAGGAR